MLDAVALECVRGERTLFSGLEFSLEAGALMRVAGPNGSGKTSLLRILCGLALPAQGEVRWKGGSIRVLREEFWRRLVYIGHAHAVKDELTAGENLAVACALGGGAPAAEELRSAFTTVGLEGFASLPGRFLSQGQRRRVALARLALAYEAPLWILDEPFTALDTVAIGCVQKMILSHLDRGGAVVLTSHQEVDVISAVAITIDLGG